MLFALIGLIWIALAGFFVLLCRAAAGGEEPGERHGEPDTLQAPLHAIALHDIPRRPGRIPTAGKHGSAIAAPARMRGPHSAARS